MISSDAIGYLASALVLAAFCMKEMIPLRVVAVCRISLSSFTARHSASFRCGYYTPHCCR